MIKKEWSDLIVENSGALYASIDITHLSRVIGKEKATRVSNVFLKISASKTSKESQEYKALEDSLKNFSNYMGVKDEIAE